MHAEAPHFLLYSEASADGATPRWKFVLQSVGGDDRFSATDCEPGTQSGRLELLAVVRGLEALGQPSRVTLLTRSRYVNRGFRRGLNHWREGRWRWERFGKFVPIRDFDLWQRIDRAMQFHQVECCSWACDEPSECGTALSSCGEREQALLVVRRHLHHRRRHSLGDVLSRFGHGVLTTFLAIWRPPFTRAA